MGEVQQAVVAAMGAPELKLLHCVSSYPAPLEQCNLSAIKTMQEAFNIEVGWSDHTTSDTAAIMAVAYGATLRLTGPCLDLIMQLAPTRLRSCAMCRYWMERSRL